MIMPRENTPMIGLRAITRIVVVGVRGMITGLIGVYRLFLSPVLPNTCRFYPSCSRYAIDAIEHHGVFRGGWMALRRIARCHPWTDSDFDPVPGSALDARTCCTGHTSPEHKIAPRV